MPSDVKVHDLICACFIIGFYADWRPLKIMKIWQNLTLLDLFVFIVRFLSSKKLMCENFVVLHVCMKMCDLRFVWNVMHNSLFPYHFGSGSNAFKYCIIFYSLSSFCIFIYSIVKVFGSLRHAVHFLSWCIKHFQQTNSTNTSIFSDFQLFSNSFKIFHWKFISLLLCIRDDYRMQ